MNISLKNQRILVTGASRGIGRAIARQLSESGAEVIIHYNTNKGEAESLLRQLKTPGHIEACDLSEPAEAAGFIPRLVGKYGPLTALVNNAGIALSAPDSLPTGEWLQIWEKTMAVNSTAVGILSKEFLSGVAPAKRQDCHDLFPGCVPWGYARLHGLCGVQRGNGKFDPVDCQTLREAGYQGFPHRSWIYPNGHGK